jgi:hypothetical protein
MICNDGTVYPTAVIKDTTTVILAITLETKHSSGTQLITQWGNQNKITIDPTTIVREGLTLCLPNCVTSFSYDGFWTVELSDADFLSLMLREELPVVKRMHLATVQRLSKEFQ